MAKYEGLGAPDVFSLGQACHMVGLAFDETCYLVGSAQERRDFRDVDVRIIMDDVKWHALFGEVSSGQIVPLWTLLCVSISEYLGRRTALKVDFQIQRRGGVSESDWAKPRTPLGNFCPQGYEPAWMKDHPDAG